MQASRPPADVEVVVYKVGARAAAMLAAGAGVRVLPLGPGGAMPPGSGEAPQVLLIGLETVTLSELATAMASAQSVGAAVIGLRTPRGGHADRAIPLLGLEHVLEVPEDCVGMSAEDLLARIADRARPGPNVRNLLFDDVLRAAVEQVTPRIAARAHRIVVAAPARGQVVDGNFTQLVQVVAYLINNASKATPEGGTIRVWVETRGAMLRCTVSDRGTGTAPALPGPAFEPFAIGVGLKAVRELTESHGGTLAAYSTGTRCGSFVLELPLA